MAKANTATVKILRVHDSLTRLPGLHSYTIDCEPDTERPETLGLQVNTLDGWKASACDQARKTGRYVALAWRLTRFGKSLTKVQFVERP